MISPNSVSCSPWYQLTSIAVWVQTQGIVCNRCPPLARRFHTAGIGVKGVALPWAVPGGWLSAEGVVLEGELVPKGSVLEPVRHRRGEEEGVIWWAVRFTGQRFSICGVRVFFFFTMWGGDFQAHGGGVGIKGVAGKVVDWVWKSKGRAFDSRGAVSAQIIVVASSALGMIGMYGVVISGPSCSIAGTVEGTMGKWYHVA